MFERCRNVFEEFHDSRTVLSTALCISWKGDPHETTESIHKVRWINWLIFKEKKMEWFCCMNNNLSICFIYIHVIQSLITSWPPQIWNPPSTTGSAFQESLRNAAIGNWAATISYNLAMCCVLGGRERKKDGTERERMTIVCNCSWPRSLGTTMLTPDPLCRQMPWRMS